MISLSKFYGHCILWLLRGLIFVLVLLAILVGGVMWRLAQGPIDIAFTKDLIVQKLLPQLVGSSETFEQLNSQGVKLEIGNMIAEWPAFDGPLRLDIEKIELGLHAQNILKISNIKIELAKAPLLIALIRPQSLHVEKLALNLTRLDNGRFVLVPNNEVKLDHDAKPISGSITQNLSEIGQRLFEGHEIARTENLSIFSYLKVGELDNGQLQFNDQRGAHIIGFSDIHFKVKRTHKSFYMTTNYRHKNSSEDNLTPYTSSIVVKLSEIKNDKKSEIKYNTDNTTNLGQDTAANYHFSAYFRHIDLSILGSLFRNHPELSQIQAILNGRISASLDNKWNIKGVRAKILSQEDNSIDNERSDEDNPQNVTSVQPLPPPTQDRKSQDVQKISVSNLFAPDVVFSDLALNIRYDQEDNVLIAQDSHIKINDQQIDFTLARRNDILNTKDSDTLPLEISIPMLKLNDIQLLWPSKYQHGVAADWLVKNLKNAEFRNLNIFIPIPLKNSVALDTEKIEGKLDYTGLYADYNSPMIPVKNANGSATLKSDVLDIEIEGGTIDRLKINKGNINITHLTHPTKIGKVNIIAKLSGPLSSAIYYINEKPINMAHKLGLDPTKVAGHADINANVFFPAAKTISPEQVEVKVDAKLDQVKVPKIVRGLDLTGGPYSLKLDKNILNIAGKGAIEGQPVEFEYQEYLNPDSSPYTNKISAQLDLDQNFRQKLGIDLSDFVRGNLAVDMDYTQVNDKDANLDFTANLKNADFFLSSLGYLKPQGEPGTAKGRVSISNDRIQTVTNLSVTTANGLQANGDLNFGTVAGSWGVKFAKFSKIKFGKYHDFSIDLTALNNNQYRITVNGDAFDASYILGGKNPSLSEDGKQVSKTRLGTIMQPSYDVTLKTARVYTYEGNTKTSAQYIRLPSIKVKTNTRGDLTYLDLSGAVGESGTVTIKLKPGAGGRMELTMNSDDAGKTLRAFGIYDNMIGGTLAIKGRQIKDGGVNDLTGRAEISKFAIVRAPLLAKFINLFSLSGLSELLQNKGIEFSKLRSDFSWRQTQGDRTFQFQNGRITGASIGLSFDGAINQTQKTIDLSGTVVPISEINGLVAKLPVLGKLLGGKSGGLIAATYSMKGPSDDPQVFINPLSVLAPGFVRSFLFENDKPSAEEDLYDRSNSKNSLSKTNQKPNYNR